GSSRSPPVRLLRRHGALTGAKGRHRRRQQGDERAGDGPAGELVGWADVRRQRPDPEGGQARPKAGSGEPRPRRSNSGGGPRQQLGNGEEQEDQPVVAVLPGRDRAKGGGDREMEGREGAA